MKPLRLFRDEIGLVLSEYLGLLGGVVLAGVGAVVVLSGALGGVADAALTETTDGSGGYLAKAGGPLLDVTATGGGGSSGAAGPDTGGAVGGGAAGGGTDTAPVPVVVTFTLSGTEKSGRGNTATYTGIYSAQGHPDERQVCGRNPNDCARTIERTF